MELMVHIHFDAKYRVEDIESLFGAESVDGEEETDDGNYKRQDLMKMHAYRDAIKRSQGAYVIYPGRTNSTVQFSGFHEMLPGLGAFSIAPDELGDAQGLEALESFLAGALRHLADRTTSLEQASYHTYQSYLEVRPNYTNIPARWSELDTFSPEKRSLAPAEHIVSVVCAPTVEALNWCARHHSMPVSLSPGYGFGHLHPDFANSRHLAVSTLLPAGAFELWKIISPGFHVLTADALTALGYSAAEPNTLYALFEAYPDKEWATAHWNKREIVRAIRAHHRCRIKLQQACPAPKLLSHPYSTTLLELLTQLTANVEKK
jgi:hypothetical protein